MISEAALEQIPTERIEQIELLLRVDSAGASHELVDWAREGRIRFSVGFDLTAAVREAIGALPESAWQARSTKTTSRGQTARSSRQPSAPVSRAGPPARA